MTSYYTIIDTIKNQLEADEFVNTVTEGQIDDVDLAKQTIFPLSHVMVTNASRTEEGRTLTYDVTVLCMDVVDKVDDEITDRFRGNDNEQDVLNTQYAVALRMVEVFDRGTNTSNFKLIGDPSFEPFTERFENHLAGWACSFQISVPNDMTSCDDLTITPICPSGSVTITDDDGNVLKTVTVASNGSETSVINDSTAVVKNSDGTTISTTSINAEASTDITLADTDYEIYVNGTLNQTVSLPTLETNTINITA